MIRVNLLPHTREARAAPEASQVWLLAVMGIIVLEIVGLFFYHQTKEDELNAIKADASQLSSQINDIKKLVVSIDPVVERGRPVPTPATLRSSKS